MPRPDLADTLTPDTTALVVVDVQNAFAARDSPLKDAGVDVSAAVERIPNVERLLDAAREAGVTVAFTRSLRRADERDAPQNAYDVVPEILRESPSICCRGSPDAEYVDGIGPRDGEYEVEKIRYDGFHGTPLEYYLRSEAVETVLLCGFATNVCVEGTARGAHERGFNVVLVEDCCASFSADQHRAGVRNVELLLGTSITLDEAREHLQAPASA